ncbi:hypothetical protein L7F22_042577 [Adiantum nelumboides]|nr:hypothetical protein [Adiantum nelumboides]
MATEHEVGGSKQSGLHTGGQFGWGDSSSCRYQPTSGWGFWSNASIPSSAGNAGLTEDCGGDFGSAKAFKNREVDWGRATESVDDDGWGEASHDLESPKAVLGKSCEIAADGWSDLYDPDCEIEELQEPESTMKCSGLTNLGNTCFMNSVLQCLTYTVPFANRILGPQHRLSCNTKDFCTTCATENHIRVVLSASGKTVSPAFLARNLDQISRSFIPGQQQDAHEFLFFLLECMQQNNCRTDQSQRPETSLVSDIFMGQMKSQVKCKSCSHCSDSVEPFLGLNLEIENCNSVKEALSEFLAVEDLQEEDKVSCSNCKQAVSRSKQLSFSKPPQVLVVQLKRYKASEFLPLKVERDIKYEASLDLTPFAKQAFAGTPGQESDWTYTLYAVLVHSGWSTSSGHYYCFVQTSPGVWHCMNDSLVSRVSEKTVLHQEAYILFYIRRAIKESLKLENVHSVNEDLGRSEGPKLLSPEESPIRDQSTADTRSLMNFDIEDLSKPLEPSNHEQVEMELEVDFEDLSKPLESSNLNFVCTQATSPCFAQQASDSKHLDSSLKESCSSKVEEPSHYSCTKKDLHELGGSKQKSQNSSKAEKNSSPPTPIAGCNSIVPNTFESASQHGYVRLLSRMPAARRQALLAFAQSGQEAKKQNSPKAASVKDKAKTENYSLQAGMGSASSKLLQKDEQQDWKGKISAREKRLTEDHDYPENHKLQRVGGKRVMASLSSGVH